MSAVPRDPYQVLGVDRSASQAEIRRAWRQLARRLHPDAGGPDGDPSRLAEVNEAWRTLSDPARRRLHDAGAHPQGRSGPSADRVGDPRTAPPTEAFTPARFPWRAMMWLGAAGIAAVIVASVVAEPVEAPPPDQLLGPGSCVDLDAAGIALEVSCEGPHEAVVSELVPFDGACPSGTRAHRDRQGLGLACIVSPESVAERS